jgi:hypothetical protein
MVGEFELPRSAVVVACVETVNVTDDALLPPIWTCGLERVQTGGDVDAIAESDTIWHCRLTVPVNPFWGVM